MTVEDDDMKSKDNRSEVSKQVSDKDKNKARAAREFIRAGDALRELGSKAKASDYQRMGDARRALDRETRGK